MDNPFVIFSLEILRVTGIQLLSVFGIFFFLGFLLSLFESWTNHNYLQTFGWKGILWTAWLGTPFHELGHYIFAKLFRHNVEEVALFEPNAETGGLGHVEHSYKKSSIYQTLGNFFIGAAPMLFGVGILTLLVYFILPNGKDILNVLLDSRHSLVSLLQTVPQVFLMIFSKINMSSWYFWLFLYISFAISAHIAPSSYDRKGMWSGFLWIVIVMLLVNITAILLRQDITSYVLRSAGYLNIFTAITLYALLMSIIHYLFTLFIFAPIRMIKYKYNHPLR
ncbi:MAG: hypothetical protein COU32_04155 [Candidatus Magasanikbacteria bacterium CG10_big_fil_rev_8_21_14_0_10_42_10]|uniref:Uncharacterized protein n=2 Tax=Candidatus Magasanikiibacteriota TaxID=1752731 RepID=A0A2H0TXC1_9BACT|nr:MAG: hypothetical protein COU32_04155 [Candidatus Magasanikbacteria bacterium CG10_big_fil_rev_8_21_14_0_10_42_10]PIZ94372.1 MAG: hypothetical protein COX82_00815 [Candidatus Magasanikbacteria bacterium CG_4_10_14_0_2_um_filter_41_10]